MFPETETSSGNKPCFQLYQALCSSRVLKAAALSQVPHAKEPGFHLCQSWSHFELYCSTAERQGSDSECLASTEVFSMTCLLYYSFQLAFLLFLTCRQAMSIK